VQDLPDWTDFKSWIASSVPVNGPLEITLTNSGSIILYHPLHFGDTFVSGGNSEGNRDGRSAVPYHAILVVTYA
jgi:hypothetical protein